MTFQDLTYVGPPGNDPGVLDLLPNELAELLGQMNGFVAYRGGLHVRGACLAPDWHSLRTVWLGDAALSRYYRSIRPTDVPFAEDALGDQFLLRDGEVWRLLAESDAVESMGIGLAAFLEEVRRNPVEYLNLAPLLDFEAQGGRLAPGQLLSVYPPFVVTADGPGRSYRAISTMGRPQYLAHLAEQVRDLPDGSPIRFEVL